jgi:hypothetical protein
VPRGYEEGPVAEEAERRRDELRRGVKDEQVEDRSAVFGSTADDETSHFLGWLDEVDPDELFATGSAWGLTVRRIRA